MEPCHRLIQVMGHPKKVFKPYALGISFKRSPASPQPECDHVHRVKPEHTLLPYNIQDLVYDMMKQIQPFGAPVVTAGTLRRTYSGSIPQVHHVIVLTCEVGSSVSFASRCTNHFFADTRACDVPWWTGGLTFKNTTPLVIHQ